MLCRTSLPRWLYFALSIALLPLAYAEPEKWESEIAALTKTDQENPPPSHGIVFVGSSSIRFWESLPQDFPGLPMIRRGFGGSELADSVHYFDRIVSPYQPYTIVLYAGENDISAGKTPKAVADDFAAFVQKAHATLPKARIIYVAMKPSPSRWAFNREIRRGNELIATACAKDSLLTFLDVYSAMLDHNEQPRPELFVEDQLHMNAQGYAIWTRLLTPLLKPQGQ